MRTGRPRKELRIGYREIAEAVGTTEGAVRVAAHRGELDLDDLRSVASYIARTEPDLLTRAQAGRMVSGARREAEALAHRRFMRSLLPGHPRKEEPVEDRFDWQ